MPTPSIRGSANPATGTGTTATGTVPAGAVIGDIIGFALEVDVAVAVTKPAAFTLNRRTATADQILETYLRVVDGSEVASYDWTFASNDFCCSMFLIKDAVGSTTPHKEAGQTNAGSTTVTAPSLTTTVDGCLLVGFFGGDISTPGVTTYTSGMTAEITDISTANWANLAIYTEAQATAGATGTRTATASVTQGNGSMGQLLAFAPAAPNTAVNPLISPMPYPATIFIHE